MSDLEIWTKLLAIKRAFIGCFMGEKSLKRICGYTCGIMTTYQQIQIILDTFKIIFIGALFGPGTAVTGDGTK